jgi:hypothetical protein
MEQTIVTRDRIWGMIAKNPKEARLRYKALVESALPEDAKDPAKVGCGAVLGRPSVIKEVLSREVTGIAKTATARRKMLTSTVSGLRDIVAVFARRFETPEAAVITTAPTDPMRSALPESTLS